MSSYNSHHLDGSYGNPGFFVARTTGTVRDSSGRTTDLTPDLTQRSARRLLIRTADLPPPVDGVYTAEIRPAKGTTGVKLAHVAIPRSTARVRAQLTLYSIPIIDRSDDEAHSTSQRYCRNQLMSKDTSDFPFFDVAVSDTDTENLTSFAYFDWRARESASNIRRFTWLSTSDRSSSIAPGMRSKFTNQYIDLDSLTVAVPSDCTVHELGNAFAHALKTHAGARHEKNSSIWNRYEIAVTESGFSVYEHMEVSDPFNTFAVHRRPGEFDNNFDTENDGLQVGSSAYQLNMITPLTIRLNKARSVFIAMDLPNNTSPIANIAGTHHKYAEFVAVETVTPDVFEITIPEQFDTFQIHSLSFPNDVTSENILGVYSNFGNTNPPQISYNIAPVTRTYQKQRDVRLGLRWGDKREGTDFLIDNNEQYESELTAGGVRRDVATLTGTTGALTREIFNGLCTTSELQDTFRSSETTMSQLFSIRKQNDAHQMQDMLFAGHMMNVAEPTPMPVSADITPENLERPEPTTENPSTRAFYADNLGWETSVISGPSNYVMAAFPVRNTHEEYSSNIDSFFGTIRTSVSPLVAKILSEHGGETNDKGFYAEMSQSTGQEHNRYDQVDLTHFEPRTEGLHSNAIVVLIGDQNYIIKSARPVSLLRNDTQHHLNLKCDGPSEVVLKSSKIRQRLEHQLRTLRPLPGQSQAQYAETVAELTRQITDNQANETHSFYSLALSDQGQSGVYSYRADQDAKYFAWVFELDRPIQLSNEPDQPPTTNTFLQRSFTGLTDRASMFVPGVYHEDSGRAAPSTVQQAAHSFFVRNGAAAEDQTLLLLHGIGNIERPLNSTANTSTEGLFTVLSAETDHKKPLQSACESSAWMRPQNIHNLKFSFVSSRTGEKLPIKDNATLLFDIYCENE